MKLIEFDYSLKDIPIYSNKSYTLKIFDQTAKFINRLRWKAFYFENKNTDATATLDDTPKDIDIYNSRRSAPVMDRLKAFESDLFDLIQNIKFTHYKSEHQKKLQKDLKKLLSVKQLIIPSDKTGNLYYVDPQAYNKLMHETITADYKLSEANTIENINNEAKNIISSANATNKKIPKYVTSEAFLTIKDHKKNFPHVIKCRNINPSKSSIGKWSKSILQRHINTIRSKTNLIQWKNSNEVTKWFNNIENKCRKIFINFDIVNFYPSITRQHVVDAISFGQTYTNISQDEIDVILHACKSVLLHKNKIWVKSQNNSTFDVAMGSYHGAEICDLVGLFMLNKIKSTTSLRDIGLYRDDGLGIIKQSSGTHLDKIKKDIIKIFKNAGFNITIDIGTSSTNFLDVSLDLTTGRYQVYTKPNTKTTYINRHSNHPPSIRKHLPKMIQNRISVASIDEDAFNTSKSIFQTALKKANYTYEIKFSKNDKKTSSKTRKRKCLYFNPPYNLSVTTNIGAKFLKLISKHFGKDHPYRKIFNRSNVKISYCCGPNIKTIINGHNRKLLDKKDQPDPKCNCRAASACPVEGKCQTKNVIYRASVTANNTEKHYVGSTSRSFKRRYYEHKASFPSDVKIIKPRNCTALANYIWNLHKERKQYDVKWEILHTATTSNNPLKLCQLCNLERLEIAKAERIKSLNRRNELVTKCPHNLSMFF